MAWGQFSGAAGGGYTFAGGAPKKQGGDRGGLFGTGIGPDLNLGLGRAFTDIKNIIPGLWRVASSAAPGGQKSILPQMGKAVAGSFMGTGLGAIDPTGHIARFVEDRLGGEENFDIRTPWESINEDGLIPGLIEHVGNVSMAGGVASQALKLGEKGAAAAALSAGRLAEQGALTATEAAARRSGLFGRAAKAVERLGGEEAALADRGVQRAMAAQTAATKIAHPYRMSYSRLLKPVLRHGPALERAAATGKAAAAVEEAATLAKTGVRKGVVEAQPGETATVRGTAELANEQSLQGLSDQLAREAVAQQMLDNEVSRAADLGQVTRPEDTVKLYRGEGAAQTAGEVDTPGAYYTDQRSVAEGYSATGKVEEIDVPKELADRWSVGGTADETGATGRQYQVPEHWRAAQGTEVPTRNAQQAAERMVSAENRATVEGAVAEARRSATETGSTGIERVAQDLANAAADGEPEWVSKLWDHLPPSMQNALTRGGHRFQAHETKRIVRDLTRTMEGAQRAARHGQLRHASNSIAQFLHRYDPNRSLGELSQMVGQEIGARADGTDMLREVIAGELTGGSLDLETQARLLDQTMRGYQGIPEDIKAKVAAAGPEVEAELERLLDQGVDQYKTQRALTFKQLLANRPGSRGVEDVLLDNFHGGWTRETQKRFKKAVNDLRKAKAIEESPNTQRQVAAAAKRQIAKETELGNLMARDERLARRSAALPEELDSLNEQRGRGMRDELAIQRTVDDIVSGTAERGGHTHNVSTGRVDIPTALGGTARGWTVGLKRLGVFTPEEWAAQADEIIRGALAENRNTLAHPDARLGTWVDPNNGNVHVDISTHDLHGRPMQQSEAWLLGLANGEISLYDNVSGRTRYLAQNTRDQGLAGRLIGDGALQKGSGFSRFEPELRAVLSGQDEELITSHMLLNTIMAWHYAQTPGTSMDDWFKQAHIEFGKRASTNADALREDLLAQGHSVFYKPPKADKPHAIIGPGQMTHANFVSILNAGEQYQRMLRWYNESHDMIEQLFGEDPTLPGQRWVIPMAYGEPRLATDVMYDAMAILSTQQTPQMNLGMAMQAMANLFEYAQSHGEDWAAQMRKDLEDIYNFPAQRASTFDPRTGKYVRRGPSVRYIESKVRNLGKGTHPYRDQRAALVDVLSGRLRLDSMGVQDIVDFNERWFGQKRVYDIDGAMRDPRVQEIIADRQALPEDYRSMLGGPEEFAIMEAFGGSLWAKYRSFRQNLAHPEDPMPVTMDMWMGRGHHPTRSDATQWGGRTSQVKGQKIHVPTRRIGTRFEAPPVNTMDVIEWNNRTRRLADQLSSVHNVDRAGLQHAIQAVHWAVFMDVFDRAKSILQGEAPIGFTPEKGYNFAEVLGNRSSKATTVALDTLAELGIDLRHRVDTGGLPSVSTGEDVVQRVKPLGRPARSPKEWEANVTYFPERTGPGGQTIKADPETGAMLNNRTGDWELHEDIPISQQEFRPILASENEDIGEGLNRSAELTYDQYQRMARRGAKKLRQWRERPTGTEGLDDAWNSLVEDSWQRVQEEWGGATINASTGRHVPDNADAYSVTVRDPGMGTIAIPIGSSREEFVTAMRRARHEYEPVLNSRFGHFGVFRNETTGMIEFDPTLVLQGRSQVDEIGTATHAQGGAYHFASGKGYWIPHVKDEAVPAHMRPPVDPAAVTEQVKGLWNETGDYVESTVLGETVPMPQAGHLMMRLFSGADFGTLLHENAHVLSLLLGDNDEMIRAMSRAFGVDDVRRLQPGSKGWVDFQERFAQSLVRYFHGAPDGRIAQNPSLKPIFHKVGHGLRAVYDEARFSFDLTPDVEEFFDNILNPDVGPASGFDALEAVIPDLPDPVPTTPGTLPQRAQAMRRRPNETDAAFKRRAQRAGALVQEQQTIRAERSALAVRRAQVERDITHLKDVVERHMTANEQRARALREGARREIGAISTKLAEGGATPPVWQPMVQALESLQKEAEADQTGEIAAMLGDLAQGNLLDRAMTLAAERGFTPTHIPDQTLEQGQARLFGNLRLGRGNEIDQEYVAATRRARTGALHRAGLADRSVESLVSAHLDIVREQRSGNLVDYIEQSVATPLLPGDVVPDGWEVWDPMRQFVLTGSQRGAAGLQEVAGGGSRLMIPKAVGDALRHMGKDYDAWPFRMVRRGTGFWRQFMLTLSPRWYVNNFIGNTILATKEGVRWRDYAEAFRQFRKKDILGQQVRMSELPEIVDRAQISEFDNTRSVLQREGNTLQRARSARQTEGLGAASKEVLRSVHRINSAWDEIVRAAVANKHLRNGATRAQALERAAKALVDYGDMGPLERSVLRSVIPFYAWQKGILKLAATFPSDHPIAAPLLMRLGRLNDELNRDRLGGPVPQAYIGALGLEGGPFTMPRGMNPFVDADSLISLDGISQNMAPQVDALIRDAYNAPEGYAENYQMGTFGQQVPDVPVSTSVADIFQGIPQYRLGQQVLTGGDTYGQQPSVEQALERFFGGPRRYTPEEMQKIIDRVTETSSRTSGARWGP